MRGRAALPGEGRDGLQAVLQQRELRGLSVCVHAAAAMLRIFPLRVLALVSPSFQVSFFNDGSS